MRVVSSCSRARLLSSMHADPTGISFYSVLSTCGLVRCLSTHPGPLGPMVDLVPESDNTAQHTRTEDVTTIADRTTGTHRPAERANLQLATGRQLANTNPRHLVMQGRDSPPPFRPQVPSLSTCEAALVQSCVFETTIDRMQSRCEQDTATLTLHSCRSPATIGPSEGHQGCRN